MVNDILSHKSSLNYNVVEGLISYFEVQVKQLLRKNTPKRITQKS